MKLNLLWLAFLFSQVYGDCPECKDVEDGPLKGKYTLLSDDEPQCTDGCLYQLESTSEKFCFDRDGLYDTSESECAASLVDFSQFNKETNTGLITQGPVGRSWIGAPWSDAEYWKKGEITRDITAFRGSGKYYLEGIQVQYGDEWAPWRGRASAENESSTCEWPVPQKINSIVGRSGFWVNLVQFFNRTEYPLQTYPWGGYCGPFGGIKAPDGSGYPFIFNQPRPNCQFAYMSGTSNTTDYPNINSLSFTWWCD